MTADVTIVNRDRVSYSFDSTIDPVASVEPPARLKLATHDARGGALLDRRHATPYELPLPTAGKGNPITGPVEVIGAKVGDALVVDIIAIDLDATGWCGGHAHVGPTRPGFINRPVGRTCRILDDHIEFGSDLMIPVAPMIGCLGTAPAGKGVSTAFAGRHGGNMDQRVVTVGARVYLPVSVPGGKLFVGDVHAAQGDGELSGVALEIGAQVEVDVEISSGLSLDWPWVILGERVMILTSGSTFEEARAEAVETMIRAFERVLGIEPADALGLLSLVGDLRVGQAYGAADVTLRLEVPASLGVSPVGFAGKAEL